MTGGGDQSWDVFISYAGPDETTAEELRRLLTERGKRAYFHPESVQAGDEWRADIPRHIEASAVTAVLLSEHYANAWYQGSEVNIAINAARYERRRVVPVRLVADVDLPFGLERVQAIDAWSATELADAADSIVALLDRPDDHENPLRRPIVSDRIPHVSRWFTGRADLLDQLVGIWQGGGSQALTQHLNGMGGVGKSTTAAALADRVRVDADVVWWLRSDQETSLVDDVVELADRLGIGELDDRRERARQAIRHLSESDLRWMLVFDNVDDERMVEPWVPKTGRGLSLVTTRDRSMTQLGPTIDVDVLPADLAVDFLLDRVRDGDAAAAADREGAASVADLVQGLPLALEQAGAWVAAGALNTWSKFSGRFADAAKNPFPDGSTPLGYELATWASIQVSIDAAAERSPLAEPLWHVLGWLASDDIPIEWLCAIADGDFFDADADELEEAVTELERYSLVALDGEAIDEVHRVVQAAAKRSAGPESGGAAVAALRAASPGQGNDPESWPVNRRLLPHALAARDAGAGMPDSVDDLVGVLDACAATVQLSGDPLASVALFESNRDMAETHLGDRHRLTLSSRASLAGSYRAAGRIPEAIALYERVLADRVEVLGDRHPDTLASRSGLAGSYWSAGRLDEAIELDERVLADRVEVLGDRHPDTLASRSGLAGSYWSAGRLDEAIELDERVLADRVEVLGDRHPDTLASRSNLASSYRAAGRVSEAIELGERVLTASVELLGDHHPNTSTSRSNLAGSYWSVGRFDEAVELEERVLSDSVEVLGDLHPLTLTSRSNVASFYWSAGRTSEAVELLRVVIDQAGELDYEHPALGTWRDALSEWTSS